MNLKNRSHHSKMKSNFLKYEMKEKNKVMNDYPIAKTHDNSNNEEKKENIRMLK